MDKKLLDKVLKKFKISEKFVIIHSNLLPFFKKTLHEPEKVWKIIQHNLRGKTIIMPTFTLSHNDKKNNHWNYNHSKSECGSLTEYFRKNISAKRSIHPKHSVAIYGPNANKIPSHNCQSSFGKGSVWEWLCNRKDVCNISLGIGLNGGATICHYPEEKMKVQYREYKKFLTKITMRNNKNKTNFFSYFVRKHNKLYEAQNNWKLCENDLLGSKILKQIKIKGIVFQKMNANQATKFIIKKMKKNPNYLGDMQKK